MKYKTKMKARRFVRKVFSVLNKPVKVINKAMWKTYCMIEWAWKSKRTNVKIDLKR